MTYDPDANAAYIYLVPDNQSGDVVRTVPVDGGDHPWMVNLDVGSDGRLVGIEVLDARSLLPEALVE
ncbi:DUF2283 domain-containing protein [Nocardioides plantarum]|uniref:DUF2283 domain-containing protein n=1 Tax=Nocardioides plantarum TaxID=29299 RepID=A0ABV5KFP6_9ACTN|nr:DUF2283 domain-containing protein [Nocardioides plantarum]